MNSSVILSAVSLSKSYGVGSKALQILKPIDFSLQEGEAVSITGASGAGKSTLLHLLGTLDQPTSGQVIFRGQDLSGYSDLQMAEFRNKKLGFVFQFHHLLSEFTALENVMMPTLIGEADKSLAQSKAEEILQRLGLDHRRSHYPSELSGGEQQRVAIARSLVQQPEILLADEPTGNLDTENSLMIQNLFFELKEKFNLSLITVTHDEAFASRFPRKLRLKDGHWA